MKQFSKIVKSAIAFTLSVVLLFSGFSPLGMMVSAATASQLGVWQTSNQFTITENGTYVVYARDAVGNVSAAYEFTVSNIDYTPPTVSVGYSTTDWTKDGVSLVIDSVDQASPGGTAGTVSLTVKDSGGTTYPTNQVFTSNVSGTVTATDDVGNSASAPFSITWIDKTSPTIGVSADITSPTNGNVVLTLTGSDAESGLNAKPFSWDGTNWSTTVTKTVSANGTYTGYVRDAVGNISSKQISVANIDKVKPTISGYSYSTTDPCNTTVVVTVNATDNGLGLADSAYSFNGGSYGSSNQYTVTANGSYTVSVKDKAGNVTSGSFSVSNLDFGKPVISSVTPNTTEQTNQDVTLTVTATDDAGGLGLADKPYRLQGYGDWQSSNILTVGCNGTYTVEVKDKAGNIQTQSIVVGNIDKEPPTAGHVLNITSPTNTDVVATLTILDNEGIKKVVTPDGTVITQVSFQSITDYTFGENGEYTFDIWDTAGNETSHTISITNIDKVKPVIDSIDRSTIKECNTFVDITVNAHDDGLGLEATAYKFTGGDWQTSNVLRVTENGTYSVSVRDVAGNIKTETFSVLNLDFDDPVINSISLNTYAQSKNDLTMTVDAVDVGLGLAQKAYRINGGAWQASNQFTITENGTYTIEVTDAAGNIVSDTKVVTNIDKELPTINAVVDITDPVNRDVVVTVTASDNVRVAKLLDNNGDVVTGTESSGVWTYTISEAVNGTYTYTVVDTAGNENTAQVVIGNIDKVKPTIDNILRTSEEPVNTSVGITVTAHDTGLGLADLAYSFDGGEWVSSNRITVTENGSYRVSVRDKAGNVSTKTYVVSNLDFDNPVINSITADITEQTNTDVIVTVDAEDIGLGLTNEPYRVNDGAWQSSNQFTITENGTYTFEVIDDADNVQSDTFTISNIDKVLPVVSHTVDIDTPTSSDVVITLSVSDDVEIARIILPDQVQMTGIGVSGTIPFTATQNGVYTFDVFDTAGNLNSYSVDIENIDKQPAVIVATQSIEGWTTENHNLIVSFTDDTMLRKVCVEGTWYDLENGELPTGAEITERDGSIIKGIKVTLPIEDNRTFEFKATDFSGAETEYSYEVKSIDRVKPSVSATTNNTNPTNGDVKIRVSASDSYGEIAYIKLPDGRKIEATSTEYTAESNGTYTFSAYDKAGNSAESSVVIDYIDKTAPKITIDLSTGESDWSNTSVIVTITAEDDNAIKEYHLIKDGVDTTSPDGVFEITENGTYEVVVIDAVGNETKETIVIGNIDKDAPTISVSVKNKYWVDNRNVLVVKGADESSGIAGYSLDGKNWQTSGEFNVSYSSSYTVYVKDLAGNITSVTVSFEFVAEPVEEVEPEPLPTVTPTPVPDEPAEDDVLAKMDLMTDGSVTVISELTDLPITAQEATQPTSEKIVRTVQKIAEDVVEVVKVAFPYAVVLLVLTLGCIGYILATDGIRVYGKNKKGKWQYLGIARCHRGVTGFTVKVSRRLLKKVDSADFMLKFNMRYSTVNHGADLTIKVGSQSVNSNIYKNVEFSVTR